MSKLQDIRNLVQEHAVSVSSSPGNWMDYMDTGENGQPDGETAGEESGTGQGSRSDGMDSTHERTDGNSGREHLDGIGIQLVEDTREDGLSKAEEEIASALSLPEYPTANEQRRQIEERAAALYAGEIPIPEEVVDEILRTGGNRKAGSDRKTKRRNYLRRTVKRSRPEYPWHDHGTGTFGYRAGGGCCLYPGRPGCKEFQFYRSE